MPNRVKQLEQSRCEHGKPLGALTTPIANTDNQAACTASAVRALG